MDELVPGKALVIGLEAARAAYRGRRAIVIDPSAALNAGRKNNTRTLFASCPEDGHIRPLPNRAQRRAAERRARKAAGS